MHRHITPVDRGCQTPPSRSSRHSGLQSRRVTPNVQNGIVNWRGRDAGGTASKLRGHLAVWKKTVQLKIKYESALICVDGSSFQTIALVTKSDRRGRRSVEEIARHKDPPAKGNLISRIRLYVVAFNRSQAQGWAERSKGGVWFIYEEVVWR
ncbi:hypothetical protein K458DRAFT_486911 [Lentithecium fluviatile CBS 122367]|uniref:Uncharacterized protein n=1 Tax=Lentithecium fluviatile CBS 122367 TaxID=1168545 RepID=A0A6G1J523_9PLEO|nr:hypothetical protein K458DRAFT_486911 [Lentithecium fluviatile CBS 122367]